MKFHKILLTLTTASIVLCLFNILSKQQRAVTEQNVSLTMHLKQLLNTENEEDALENAIILQQTLINSFETDHWNQYLHPIPIENRTISIVFSSWRTGSTFLGDIINAVPGTYYHYEPFNYRSVEQQESNMENVEHVLKLIKCQFGSDAAMEHIAIDAHWHYNSRLYKYCAGELGLTLCKRQKFREKFCNIFPRQVMKLVRARISLADALLNNTDIDVKVILQVRDPRAVYLSRKTLEGCSYHPHCHSIEQYCKFLVDDHGDVQRLLVKYASRIRILRYEEFARDPFKGAEQLFSFLKLPYTKEITDFLTSHTAHDEGDVFSTYRDSKSTVTHWIKDLNASEMVYVEKFCKKAMKLWGYKLMENDSKEFSNDFNPVEKFVI